METINVSRGFAMVEQFKLRDIDWVCNNSVVACEAVLPCFDAFGQIKMVLVLSRRWGWLTAPADKLRHQGLEVAYNGKLEDLFKISERALEKFQGLFHFDPWWLVRTQPGDMPRTVADAILAANLAAATYMNRAVHSVMFQDSLDLVERIDVGSSLWRRSLSGEAMTAWLRSDPMRDIRQMRTQVERTEAGLLIGADDGHIPGRDDDLYKETEGPLKLVSQSRRVGTSGRAGGPAGVIIGQPRTEGDSGYDYKLPSKMEGRRHTQEIDREFRISQADRLKPEEVRRAQREQRGDVELYEIADDQPSARTPPQRQEIPTAKPVPPQRQRGRRPPPPAEPVQPVEPVEQQPPPPPAGDVNEALARIRQRIQRGRRG